MRHSNITTDKIRNAKNTVREKEGYFTLTKRTSHPSKIKHWDSECEIQSKKCIEIQKEIDKIAITVNSVSQKLAD